MALNNSDLPKLVELLNLIDIRVQNRRKTAANWVSANEVLRDGEWGLETDTGKIKMGDGSTAWNSLDYFSAGTPIGTANAGANIDIDVTNPDIPVISSTLGAVTLKGRVASYGSLPSSGNTAGDAYVNDADKLIYVWDGSAWPSYGAGLRFGSNQWWRLYGGTSMTNNFSSAVNVRNAFSLQALINLSGTAASSYEERIAQKIGFVFGADSTAWNLTSAYFGKAKNNSQGYPIEFDGTPMQVTFSGSGSIAIASNTQVKADPLNVASFSPTDTLVMSYFTSSSVNSGRSGSVTGLASYYKYSATNESSNTSITGYSSSSYAQNGLFAEELLLS